MGCNWCKGGNEYDGMLNLDLEVKKEREKKLRNKNSFNKFENNLMDTNRKLSSNLNRIGTFNSNIDFSTTNNQLQNNLVFLINKLRQDPLFFIPIIDKYSEMVQFNNKKKHYYITVDNFKIILNEGQEAFKEAKNFLQNIKPVNKLTYFEDLNIHFPSDKENCDNGDYIQSEIDRIKNESRIKFSEISCICNKNVPNEEYIIVSNIIDMDSPDKINRDILLNGKFTKIGVNSGKINDDKNIYCVYMTFGEENQDEF